MSEKRNATPSFEVDNSESILRKVSSLYSDRSFSDVTLCVGGREYPAHRLILCTSSDVFQVMLMKPEWSESCESVIVLHEAEECVPHFGSFLRYLYTGQVSLAHTTVLPILALADKYNVEDLRVVCGNFMREHVVSAAKNNLLLSWLQYCMASQHTSVATACLNHFKWNFEEVARTSDFLNCDVGLLKSVLAQHDLVIHDEMTLYSNVVNWLKHQPTRLQVIPFKAESLSYFHQTMQRQPSCHRCISNVSSNRSDGLVPCSNNSHRMNAAEQNDRFSQRKMYDNRKNCPCIDAASLYIQENSFKNCHVCDSHQVHSRPCTCCGRVQRFLRTSCHDQFTCQCLVTTRCCECRCEANRVMCGCCAARPCFHQQHLCLHVSDESSVNESRQNRCKEDRKQTSFSALPVTPPPLQLGTGKLYLRCNSGYASSHSSNDVCTGSDTSSPALLDNVVTVDDLTRQMEFLIYEVMSFIRFPMMTPRQLADLLLDPLTIHYKEFFVTRMAIGMAFHSGKWPRVREIAEDGCEASRLLFTPRLYTAEQWSAGLTVDNLPSLPLYQSRTLVFSTPASSAELENDSQLEWIVELYPKGVLYRKYQLIVWQGTLEVPEVLLQSVRLSVTFSSTGHALQPERNSSCTSCPRVRIAALIHAHRDGVEYVSDVVTRCHIFTPEDCRLNINDVLPYDALNDDKKVERYLLPPSNSFRLHVVISPLPPHCICSATA